LEGLWGIEKWPTRMCGLDLWLKPFKGGYSNNRRVVNISYLYSLRNIDYYILEILGIIGLEIIIHVLKN